jgi:hypothetical protein
MKISNMSNRFVVASIIFTSMIAPASMSLAQPAPMPPTTEERGKAAYKRGEQLTQEGNFKDAYVAFDSGWQAAHHPLFLFNMAECARKSGDIAKAKADYERYLLVDPNGSFASVAKQRLAELAGPTPAPVPPAPVPVVVKPAAKPPVLAPATVVTSSPPPEQPASLQFDNGTESKPSLFRRPVFWIVAGGVVVAGATTAYLLTRGGGKCSGAGCVTF